VTPEAPLVLVVEDDPDLSELEAMVLEAEGYAVRKAAHGREALEAVAERMPQLILLDMKMPVMDGATFTAAFRERHGRAAPIVVVTAADNARRRAQEVNADAWVAKPFDPEVLLAAVLRLAPKAHR
jgi:CheY-like chemotaxis protein